jgi:hypothetical protein
VAKTSYSNGHILTTSKESRTQYGVVQAPFGLNTGIRGACAVRGSSTGNTPLDNDEIFDCSGDTPTPPTPPPGNKNLDLGQIQVYPTMTGAKASGAGVFLNLPTIQVYPTMNGPTSTGGAIFLQLGQIQVYPTMTGPDHDG